MPQNALSVSQVPIEIDQTSGEIKLHKLNNIIAGYTLGNDLFKFHPSNDSDLSFTRKTLTTVGINNPEKLLRIYAEHRDKILVDEDGDCDAIISTQGNPISLAPADCIGLIAIVPHTKLEKSIYGIAHIGRAGIGLNLANKFVKAILKVAKDNHQYPENLHLIVSPHIYGESYPHDNLNFAQDTWWGAHPESITHKDGKYYPHLEIAYKLQLQELQQQININLNIIDSGINTFTSQLHSHSRALQTGTADQKKRNLVFVGKSNSN